MANELDNKLKSRTLDSLILGSDSLDAILTRRQKPLREPIMPPGAGEPLPDIEEAPEEELSELLAGFKSRAREENRRFLVAVDSEFWFAICFQTREQKDAFLKATRWAQQGDKYLDGQWVAKQLAIDLPPADIRYNVGKTDRKLNELI